ncbi:hypothetical protein GDO78_019907 [Eleutherodactylus coqui]|uniref:Uncharacterized protein n=1 Tax=Eleutherodactylus coqui TaxID=57060 RepID=A0A8J6BPC0_ELECQ|nr:hypothetical protein GDO78_019907 [Eleutherodactylus coqui]
MLQSSDHRNTSGANSVAAIFSASVKSSIVFPLIFLSHAFLLSLLFVACTWLSASFCCDDFSPWNSFSCFTVSS